MIIALGIIIFILVMVIIILVGESKKTNPNTQTDKLSTIKEKPKRRRIEDVKQGEWITIEWHRVLGGTCILECLNNDVETKKILLNVKWNKPVRGLLSEKLILNYNSDELKNFHLLNQVNLPKNEVVNDEEEIDYDIAKLQKQMNKAHEEERFEEAHKLQKKIDKILAKTKENP